jgi:hypothetical protein
MNPGEYTNISVAEHARRWDVTNFSAYLHQCWRTDCWRKHSFGRQTTLTCLAKQRPGMARHPKDAHQSTVLRLLRSFGGESLGPTRVLSTNAIFIASRLSDTFKKEHQVSLLTAWNKCWRVHRFMLNIVRPRIIICFGYGESGSPYDCMARVSEVRSRQIERGARFKWFDARFAEIGLSSRVIGVFHPSWGYRIKDEARLKAVVTQGLSIG